MNTLREGLEINDLNRNLVEKTIQIDRFKNLTENILKIINEVCNLTENKQEDWSFTYRGNFKDVTQLSAESLNEKVPLDPKIYLERYTDEEINDLKTLANLPVKSKAPQTEEMNELRRAAGII